MSKELFGRLLDHARNRGDPVLQPDAGRYIQRLDDEDAELMSQAEARPLVVTRHIRLVRIEHKNDRYFFVSGLAEPEVLPEGLELAELTPGLFAVGVIEAQSRPPSEVSSAAIKDALDDYYIADGSNYIGHELETISALFPDSVIYRSLSNVDYHGVNERVIGSLLARSYLDGPIELESSTIEIFTNLFEYGPETVPFRNLVQGILSISWENLFLEIYRCIEQLYSFSKLAALKKELGSRRAIRDLSILIERSLGWRAKEDEAIRDLILECPEPAIRMVAAALDVADAKNHSDRCRASANALYKLRNRVVHYRPIHERVQLADVQWNELIRGMLSVVSHLYEAHSKDFFGR